MNAPTRLFAGGVDSPIGLLALAVDDVGQLRGLSFGDGLSGGWAMVGFGGVPGKWSRA